MVMQIDKRKILLKAVSLLLVMTFSLSGTGLAVTDGSLEKPAHGPEAKEDLSVDDIGIAINAGIVKSKYKGETGKIVVHIQDAHCNYEAQSNINKILDQLAKEDGIDMISVEGAEGIVDTSWFRAFPDPEIRREVADYFMKKGEITGAEFFSINSDYRGTIFGAENRDSYVENLKAFTDVYPYKDVIEKYFLNLRTIANRLKSYIYSPKLKEVDRKITAFGDKDIELGEYAGYLNESMAKYRIPAGKYTDFKKLVDTLEYEKKIDFDIVDQERNKYIDALSVKLTKDQMAELVSQSIKFKKGHIKAVDFYSHLRELAKEHNIPIVREFPNLFYYYLYTKIYDTIDNENLFNEISAIEGEIKNKLFSNDVQRKLDSYSGAIDLHIDLVNIELTNEDYDRFEESFRNFSLEDVVNFMSAQSDKYGLNYTLDGIPVQVSKNLPKMVSFYKIAMERDNILIDNTLKQMEKDNKNACVLIAGGFHTKGIKNILEDKGISYLVVTPKITKDVETPYIKVLTNQRTSLEDIITESAAMPGMGAAVGKEGGTLKPLDRIAYMVPLYINPDREKDLERLSESIGAVEGGMTVEETAAETYRAVVGQFVNRWLDKVRDEARSQLGEKMGTEKWNEFLREDNKWILLQKVYFDKCDEAGMRLSDISVDVIGSAFSAYRQAQLGLAAPAAVMEEARAAAYEPSAKVKRALALIEEAKYPVTIIPTYTSLEENGVIMPLMWYGAEEPSKAVTIMVGDVEVPLREALAFPPLVEALKGAVAVSESGEEIPMAALIPEIPAREGRVADISNVDRIVVVTDIDRDALPAGETPTAVAGFNTGLVVDLGIGFIPLYKEALVKASAERDSLVSVIKQKGYEKELAGIRDLTKLPPKLTRVPEIARVYREFTTSIEELNRFYNTVEVTEGQVIPVQANQLFALPPEVKAIETRRPADERVTVPLAPLYPAEYPFIETVDGRPQLVASIEKAVSSVNPGIIPRNFFPMIRPSDQDVFIETIRSFETRGLQARRITLAEGAEMAYPEDRPKIARNIAVLKGRALIRIGEEEFEVPGIAPGENALVIPASVGDFKIIATGEDTQIIETYAPRAEKIYELPIFTGREIPVVGGYEYSESIVFDFYPETMRYDTHEVVTIVEGTYPVNFDEGSPFAFVVQEGEVQIKINDEEGPRKKAGEVFIPPANAYKIEMTNVGAERPAKVRMDRMTAYDRQIQYAGFDMMRKRIEEINQAGPVNVIMPSEMLAEGGVNDPGSRDWWQKMFRTYVNPEISINPYWSEERSGVKQTGLDAAIKNMDPRATNILIATESKINGARDNKTQEAFIAGTRVMGIPDIDQEQIDGEANPLKRGAQNLGWLFTREAIGAALLLSIVTPETVFFDEGIDTPASDMQRFMSLILGRDVSRGDLCYMLPYDEVMKAAPAARERWSTEDREVPEWFRAVEKDLRNMGAWLASLLKKVLLTMPIKPFDTNEDILKRQENMFKAIKAV